MTFDSNQEGLFDRCAPRSEADFWAILARLPRGAKCKKKEPDGQALYFPMMASSFFAVSGFQCSGRVKIALFVALAY